MTNRTRSRLTDRGPLIPNQGTFPAAANSLYPRDTMVGMDASGRAYAYTSADASGFPCVGIARATFDNRTNTTEDGFTGLDDPANPIETEYGTFGFDISGTTPLPNQDLFVVDNQTVSIDSLNGTRGKAGKCSEVRDMGLAGLQAFFTVNPALGSAGSTGYVSIPLPTFTLGTGGPLTVFADASSPTFGLTVLGNEALAIRWNNDAAPGAAFGSVAIPPDLDESKPAFLDFECAKSGATVGDATTLTATVFLIANGDLYDADVDAGGVSNALPGAAVAKTTGRLTITIAAADIQAAAELLNFTVKPTAGTLGTDDLLMLKARLRYTRK